MKNKKGTDEFKKFKIPENYFNRLFEFTGTQEESSKGFICAYVNQEGYPLIYTKIGSPIVQMGLTKALEKYLEEENLPEDLIDNSLDE